MLWIKNVQLPTEEGLQQTNLLLGGEKILAVDRELYGPFETLESKGLIAIPGLMDNHVHVTGGGGEAGFFSRAPEVQAKDLLESGITTVMGLLGTDSYTRSVENLLAKLYGLREQHVSAYGFTGSYRYPSNTLTGDVAKDIVFLPPILGVKIATSDHRSSNISTEELARLAATARTAGMVSKKPGTVVIHMGDGKAGLEQLFAIARDTEIPLSLFQPTHINRNPQLLQEGFRFLEMGGSIDLTCGVHRENTPAKIIAQLQDSGLNCNKITVSSDGNGSYSTYDEEGNLTKIGIAKVSHLYEEFCAAAKSMGISAALPYFTSNVARKFQLPQKGSLSPGKDGDVILMKEDFSIVHVFSQGRWVVKEGQINTQEVISF